MKRSILRILFYCLLLLAVSTACDSLLGLGKAEIVLDGQLSINMPSAGVFRHEY